MMKKTRRSVVAIVMGSDSDWPVMKKAFDTLQLLNVPCEVHVLSAHRTPKRMLEFAENARANGVKVIIAGAGGAAHLPGMIASATTIPVVGVPVHITKAAGLDALLSIVQMPAGVPVATVAIDNAQNAALLAGQILSVSDLSIAKRVEKKLSLLRKRAHQKVIRSQKSLQTLVRKSL